MDGLLRYNAIQSALSPIRKEKGWKLPVGGFQSIASKIYQKTKTEPLKQVINNIDLILEDIPADNPPYFPAELSEFMPFFAFDSDAKNGMGKVNNETFENIFFRSPQLYGEDDYLIDSSLLSYDEHFRNFSQYCNQNRNIWWTDSHNAPLFRFTEPKYDWSEQKWYTVIELGQDDGYGYEPGIGATVKKDVIIKPPEEKPPEEEEKPSEKEKELEIRKIQAQTELAKASTAKLSELNKAVDRLDSQLDRGLITKEEYKTYLKRLYEL
jgi:hypothetical protein